MDGVETLGQYLRKARKQKELTQEAVARAVGIDTSYLSKIENDSVEHTPSIKTLAGLADVLELDELELIERADKMPPSMRNLAATPAALRFLRRAASEMETAEDWEQLNRYLDAERGRGSGQSAAPEGSSPYATGGGGFTFEHRVGAVYLARLITSSPLSELGERAVGRVAFQQAASSAVDDLVVTGISDNQSVVIRLAVACRRRPQFTRGNAKTKELFTQLVRASRAAEDDSDVELRLAIAVAGNQGGAGEVSELAGIARNQHGASAFFALVNESGQFSNRLRTRLAHLRDLVELAQASAGVPDVSADERCWRLLTQLRVLRLSVEPSDEADWVALAHLLKPWAAEGTLASAIALRNRLEALAAEYAQTAADVDANIVRRRLHDSIDPAAHRTSEGWTRLRLLDEEARAAVSRSLVGSGVHEPLKLGRAELQTNLAACLAQRVEDVVVRGESGVGKSALVFDATETAALEDDCEVIAINLRNLPQTILEVVDALSAPLEELLAGMTAPDGYLSSTPLKRWRNQRRTCSATSSARLARRQ